VFINTTIETSSGKLNIRIDSEQVIGNALTILRESGKLPEGSSPDYFHSRLNQRPVSAYMTFGEENIHDGDILSAIE